MAFKVFFILIKTPGRVSVYDQLRDLHSVLRALGDRKCDIYVSFNLPKCVCGQFVSSVFSVCYSSFPHIHVSSFNVLWAL